MDDSDSHVWRGRRMDGAFVARELDGWHGCGAGVGRVARLWRGRDPYEMRVEAGWSYRRSWRRTGSEVCPLVKTI